MLNCEHATRMASEARDRDLSLGERMGLGLHLFMCRACRVVEDQFALIDLAVKKWNFEGALNESGPRLPDSTREEIMKRMGLR